MSPSSALTPLMLRSGAVLPLALPANVLMR
jgi:hypothetical protein